MKVNEERNLLKTMMGLLLIAGLFVGCAKELPEDVSDDIVETAHSLSLFEASVEIASEDGDGIMAMNSREAVSDIVAVNEIGLREVKMVKGPSQLAPFFKDLKLESSFPGEKFTVHFAFNSGTLVAYAEVKNQRLSLINEQLVDNIKTYGGKTVKAYPIFQYSVSAFGTLERAENALGEQTRTVLFKPKAMDNATHIKIDPKAERRKDAGYRFNELDEVKVVFNKNMISKRLFKTKEIVELFNYSSGLQANSSINSDSFLKLSLLKNKAVIQVPVHKSELTIIEKAALDANDPRIKACDKRIAQAAKVPLSNCVLRPLYSVSLKHIKLKKKYDEGVLLAQMDSPFTLSNVTDSKLIEIDLDNRLVDATIGKDINLTDEILTTKEKHFDLDAEYLYVPMTMGTPREVIAADPFFQGKEKIVKMKFVKDGLEIYELEKDDRFGDNDLNNKPVLKIAGKHKDYKCKEDENDECVGGDVEDKDKEWHEKRFFMPTLDNLQVRETNPLDVMTVEADSCLQKVDTKLVDYTIKNGVLNIELEKTYKTSKAWRCIADHYFEDTENMTGFSNAGFKVRFFYSVVRLKDLASPDYEKVAYPIPDHDQFGFFKDKISKLSPDYDRQRKENNYLLNRWNPKKGKVVYHLSDTFDKPKNKLIKDATIKAFEGMNRSLRMANAGIELELVEPSGKKSGDLRNSMIVLIDDPLSNGLLGYAPTVTNPRTGEIVQGHINMYSGVLTSIARHNWEGMVDFTVKKVNEQKSGLEKAAPPEEKKNEGADDETLKKLSDKKLIRKVLSGTGGNVSSHVVGNASLKLPLTKLEKIEKLSKGARKAEKAMEARLKERFVWTRENDRAMENASEFEKLAHKHMMRMKRFAENNALSDEAYKIAHTTKALIPGIKEIKGVFNEDGTLKRWKDLTPEQKQQATDIIVPYSYTATLVHEVGHGLGLRHNFIASKDADNYWTEEEAKELGLTHAPAYSSVMDYAFDTLNESTIFGKYDIAALRFAYAREVEVNVAPKDENGQLPDGVKPSQFIKVETTLTELSDQLDANNGSDQTPFNLSLRPYDFCTDSNAGLSASCNRFDEGSTLVEITNHYISKYEDYYRYRNFRDGRNTYQAEGLGGYAIARFHEFNRIRGIFEEWEFFASIFGPDLMAQGCGPEELKLYPICKDINERRDSVKIAGDFFLRVLKMPDLTCALAKADEPTKVVELRTLYDIYDDVKFSIDYVTKTCFDPAVKKEVAEDNFVVVGEAGKFLNGFKDNSPIHIYSNDRAVRGVWIDKVMAMKALLQRKSGRPITERTHMAMVDHGTIAPKFGNFLRHILLGDDLLEPVPFKREDGSLYEQEYSIDMDYIINGPQRSLGWLKNFFNMPESGKANLIEVLLSNGKDWGTTRDEDYGQESHDIVNLFTVRRYDLGYSRDLSDMNFLQINDTVFAATETNSLAYMMIDSFNTLEFLKGVEDETVLKVVNRRLNPPLPEDLTEEEQIAIKLPDSLLNSLLQAAEATFSQPEENWLTLEFFVQRFGEQMGTDLYKAYMLKVEGLKRVIALKEGMGKPPAMSSEIELKLYEMDLDILRDYVQGTLERKTELYQQRIPLMPNYVEFR